MSAGSELGTRNSQLPRLYPIVDASCFPDDRALFQFVAALLSAGVTLLQYRNKQGSPRQMLSHARELRRLAGDRARLIMNDRADLCLAADFDGVHVGQDDFPPEAVRKIFRFAEAGSPARSGFARDGVQKPLWMGVSTHNPEQLRLADQQERARPALGGAARPGQADPECAGPRSLPRTQPRGPGEVAAARARNPWRERCTGTSPRGTRRRWVLIVVSATPRRSATFSKGMRLAHLASR